MCVHYAKRPFVFCEESSLLTKKTKGYGRQNEKRWVHFPLAVILFSAYILIVYEQQNDQFIIIHDGKIYNAILFLSQVCSKAVIAGDDGILCCRN